MKKTTRMIASLLTVTAVMMNAGAASMTAGTATVSTSVSVSAGNVSIGPINPIDVTDVTYRDSCQAVTYLANRGALAHLLDGDECQAKLHPEYVITRAEFVGILQRLLGDEAVKDLSKTDTAKVTMSWMGSTVGKLHRSLTGGGFASLPVETRVTREQACSYIVSWVKSDAKLLKLANSPKTPKTPETPKPAEPVYTICTMAF